MEDGENLGLAAFVGHQQHALLRFGQHDLVRRHAGLALRHVLQIDLDASFRAAAHFAGGASEPGGAHVLNADDRAGLHRFQAGFEQELFEKRIAHLHVRTFLFGLLGELGRRHRRAVNAIAPGLRADVNHRIADAGGLAVKDFILAEHAQREGVHQRIAVVAILENALATHRRDAEAISVVRDTRDDAFKNAAIAGDIERTEADRIHHGDRPRAHGENIAQDAAYAGSRALERLNKAGMIVRFDFERDRVAIADVDDARVLARPLQHQLAARRQLLQMNTRAFVRAMLAPHHAEDAEFGIGRLAPEQRDDLFVLRLGELVSFDGLRSNDLWRHSLMGRD